jgi:phenylpyruvate tautomerase
MPYLKLSTNTAVPLEQTEQLMAKISQTMARETGKPERYVMVEISMNAMMMFAGSTEPLAYLECKSIGLSSSQTQALAKALPQLLNEQLKVASDRIYIEFSNCSAENWGWNESTFG